MAEQRVECPKCGHKFAVTKALTDQIENSLRKEYMNEATALEKDLKASYGERLTAQLEKAEVKAKKDAKTAAANDIKELKKQLADAERAEKAQEQDFERKLKLETKKIVSQAKVDSKEAFSEEMKELNSQVRKKNKEINDLHEMTAELVFREAALAKKEKAHKEDFERQLKIETGKIVSKAKVDAQEALSEEMEKLNSQVRKKNKEIDGLRERAAELEDREAALAKKEQSIKVKIERERVKARREAEKDVAAELAKEYKEYKEQDLQHTKIVADLRKQLIETQMKLDQRSQELKGEVVELDIEKLLSATFPNDEIEPVKKGKLGADIVQRVFTPSGTHCGTIVWEIKSTKN